MNAEDDTIVAIATPYGKGALSIIRLSGNRSWEVSKKILRKSESNLEANRPIRGEVRDSLDQTIDQVVGIFFKNPNSFTGEDMVEISCHGNPVITKMIVEVVLENGARLADPGEFTLRAFLNSKIDLSQAEGIQSIIEAQSKRQVRTAARQLSGNLAAKCKKQKKAIEECILRLEAPVEFVEQAIDSIDKEGMTKSIQEIEWQMNVLMNTFNIGSAICHGKKVAIVGRPNVGKSSIFNKIVNFSRAIVSRHPGTTRDTIQEPMLLRGIPVTFIDTAGWRRAANVIEKEGIRRSGLAIDTSDIVLLVMESKKRWQKEDRDLLERIIKKNREIVVIYNKVDLDRERERNLISKSENFKECNLCAKTGEGIRELLEIITETIPEENEEDDVIVCQLRQFKCLENAKNCLEQALRYLECGYSEEYISEHLRNAIRCMGEISGEFIQENLLNSIFSKFCIGK